MYRHSQYGLSHEELRLEEALVRTITVLLRQKFQYTDAAKFQKRK